MHVQIQTIDGQFFASDEVDIVESGLTPQQYEQAVGELEGLFENFGKMDYIALQIGERSRYFNPRNVLWAEVVR